VKELHKVIKEFKNKKREWLEEEEGVTVTEEEEDLEEMEKEEEEVIEVVEVGEKEVKDAEEATANLLEEIKNDLSFIIFII
jgi:hypothetical protein